MNKIFGCLIALCGLFCIPAFADTCSALQGETISSSNIKLTTGGAFVSTAATQSATSTLPQYCKIIGFINPYTTGVPPIHFEVNLPTTIWNNKSIEYGGGGFDGSLISGLAALTEGLPSVGLPLNQGYVTYGSDSGHVTPSNSADLGEFASTQESFLNFAGAAVDKTHDVAMYLINQFYGTYPTESYFFGHSEGGREAMAAAELYYSDFNGVVAMNPVINWSMLQMTGDLIGLAQANNNGWLDSGKLTSIATQVVSKCDSLDGIADGVVSNYAACTPSVVYMSQIECAGGSDLGDYCLSSDQLTAYNNMHSVMFSAPSGYFANGQISYPGFLYGGEELTGGMSEMEGTEAATFPDATYPGEGVVPYYGCQYAEWFIFGGPPYGNCGDGPTGYSTGIYLGQTEWVSSFMDMDNPNLSAFFSAGGKLIMEEGTADYAQSPVEGMNYYTAVESSVGTSTAQASMRLYISPNTIHNGGGSSLGGTPIASSVDLLGALDTWVTTATEPGTLTQYQEGTTPPYTITRSRPLCLYGQYPAYVSGNPANASSYSCTGTVQ